MITVHLRLKMKLLGLLLLVTYTASAPTTSKEDDVIIITDDFFPEQLAVYSAEHDIVEICVPLNAINFSEDSEDDDTNDDSNMTYFFVEADLKANKEKDYKGLYIFKHGQATKLLDNGRAITATTGNDKSVYFGATDGLYSYDNDKNTVVKYGSITDSIVALAKPNEIDTIYILTENKEMYKVTQQGNKKEKFGDVKNAEQFVLDDSDNIYYYADGKIHVANKDGVKEIQIPDHTKVRLMRPPFIVEEGVPALVDNKIYLIFTNGTSQYAEFELQAKPTAFAMEATLIQYYAYNKKIYEYNMLALIMGQIIEQMSNFLEENRESIRKLASRPRSGLHA